MKSIRVRIFQEKVYNLFLILLFIYLLLVIRAVLVLEIVKVHDIAPLEGIYHRFCMTMETSTVLFFYKGP